MLKFIEGREELLWPIKSKQLIANDIVNYGMDKTTSFNYIVSLNDFLDDYDDETRDYIKSHINGIIDAVHGNENVAQLDYDDVRQEFDIIFYFDGLMSKLDKKIYESAKEMGIYFKKILFNLVLIKLKLTNNSPLI